MSTRKTAKYISGHLSGKVRFQQYDLLIVSSHREYGFVSFSALGPYAHDAIVALLPSYPHITTDPIPYNFSPLQRDYFDSLVPV